MTTPSVLALALLVAAGSVAAHGDAEQPGRPARPTHEQKAWGIAGDSRAAKRTIEVTISDRMRFSPDSITVRRGETVRFLLRNEGRQPHEFVLGTKQDLDEHAALMAKFPDMQHDEPYMAHVQGGQTAEIVWTFNRAGEFDFGCLIPGHYQAGMVGRVVVTAAAK